MMRYQLNKREQDNYFSSIYKKSGSSWQEIAQSYGVSKRTFFDWRHGKITLPDSFVKQVKKRINISLPETVASFNDNLLKIHAGRIGGLKRVRIYGNPGTPQGRSMGGQHAIKTHLHKSVSSFIAKDITIPKHSLELAELVGIILGDGGISKYQVTISLHAKDDRAYSSYVAKLIEDLFNFAPSLFLKRKKNVIDVVISRKNAVKFFNSMGLHIGSKILNFKQIPKWISSSRHYSLRCVRGIFDTDGCIYIDSHIIRGRLYRNCGMSFVNRSLPILEFFKHILQSNNFHPTQKTKYAVFLRREKEIMRYLRIIGTSNPKYLKRFDIYFKEKHGRVPKWS